MRLLRTKNVSPARGIQASRRRKNLAGRRKQLPEESASDEQPFNRMLVKIKKEIIAFGVDGIDPARDRTGAGASGAGQH